MATTKRVKPTNTKTLTVPYKRGKLVYVNPAELVMQDQVRTVTNEKDDAEFFESIKLHGVRTPIQAREVDGKYLVTFGHRRTTAAVKAELAEIPVYVVDTLQEEVIALQLVENLQRSDMTLMDVADGVWKLYNSDAGGSAKLTGAMIGKGKAWVSKMLLLSAPGKAHSVARRLMAADKLGDIEMAYLICQVEAIDKPAAEEIATNIDTETRATVKAKLQALRGDNPEAGEGDDEGGEGGEGGKDDDEPIFSAQVLAFIQRVVTDATVKPADMGMKKAALDAIRIALDSTPAF